MTKRRKKHYKSITKRSLPSLSASEVPRRDGTLSQRGPSGGLRQAGAPWRFDSFTQDDYRTLYEDLRTSVLKMDAYSDLDTLPETPNVTVNRLP